MSIFDVVFLIISCLLCYMRYKGHCSQCPDKRMGDIFQILFTSIAIVLMVGTVPILKLLAIMIFSYIIRESFSSTKEKVKTIVKKCYYCEDFWK